MNSPIKIVIADDHPIFRDGFKVLLREQTDIQLVGEANNGEELIHLVKKVHPDVVITDIKMPVMDGIDASKFLSKHIPDIKIIALSVFNDDYLVVDMLEAGAHGYLLKNTTKQELFEAIKTVASGDVYYCNDTSVKMARLIGLSKFNPYKNIKTPRFSNREMEIMRLICEQFSNKEIAENLHLSIRTIESYREQIFEKTSSRNMVGVAIYAIKHNIYPI
jgi:DNA-binding NarL/FixJ family response regulator